MLAIVLSDGIIGWIKLIIIVAACVGVLFVLLRVSGVTPPPWLIQILWIVLAAVVAILAITFVASL